MEIKLWEKDMPYFNNSKDYDTPNTMRAYLLDTDKPLGAVVVYPGGGYTHRAPHEADVIAEFYNSKGFHAFVVDYRIFPYTYPAQLIDAQRAIKIIRKNAKEWKVDSEKIAVCGFSAGGHLAEMTLLCDDVCTVSCDDTDKFDARPNAGILCYPVVDISDEFGHIGTGRNLLGSEYEKRYKEFCMQNRDFSACPPCFLWHTSEDAIVHVKNSFIFCEKLREKNIPFELHVFPKGYHGLGLATKTDDYIEVREWANLSAKWLERTFKI